MFENQYRRFTQEGFPLETPDDSLQNHYPVAGSLELALRAFDRQIEPDELAWKSVFPKPLRSPPRSS